MKINNVELPDMDIFDADTAEKYEKALNKIVHDTEDLKSLKTSAVIRKQCNLVFEFFNSVLGEGTDKKIFGDRVNLKICLKAFEELVDFANEQKKEIEAMSAKYSTNRAQRRANKQ